MVTRPAVHPSWTTVDRLRAFFDDDHVHIALLVDDGRLVGTVERGDLTPELGGEDPAEAVATLDGRTVRPHADLSGTFAAMRRDGRRRLAVTEEDSTLLGLLCVKASGRGFCSDADVAARRCAGGPARRG